MQWEDCPWSRNGYFLSGYGLPSPKILNATACMYTTVTSACIFIFFPHLGNKITIGRQRVSQELPFSSIHPPFVHSHCLPNLQAPVHDHPHINTYKNSGVPSRYTFANKIGKYNHIHSYIICTHMGSCTGWFSCLYT